MNVTRRCRYGLMNYPLGDMWAGRSLDAYGEYMESEIGVLRGALRPDDVAVDAGAGFGTHTLAMSRAVGAGGRVLALEPERTSFYHLCANVAINDIHNVYCFQQAIGRENQPITVPELDPANTVHYGGLQLWQEYPGSVAYKVHMQRIDDFDLNRVDLIKADVEGMELDLLEGAAETIKRHRPVIYVENDPRCGDQVRDLLLGLDYDVYLQEAPLFNPQNFFREGSNIFVNEAGAVYVTSMYLAMPREKMPRVDPGAWNMQSMRYQNSKCTLAHGGKGTTTLSTAARVRNNDYERFFRGSGIDIGGGYDTLQTPHGTVRPWDVRDGDAVLMAGVPDESYDFVYSSHCLEHLTDVPIALENWARILRPGGYMFVVVPDWTLYEQHTWPSKFNTDHKATFSLDVRREDVGRDDHYHISSDIGGRLHHLGVDLLETRLEDDRYDHSLSGVDQTGPAYNAVAQVVFIGRKRPYPGDGPSLGR